MTLKKQVEQRFAELEMPIALLPQAWFVLRVGCVHVARDFSVNGRTHCASIVVPPDTTLNEALSAVRKVCRHKARQLAKKV